MKKSTINNLILAGFFAVLIFGFNHTDIATFILFLFWLGSNYEIDKQKKYMHVFQILNDIRHLVTAKMINLSPEQMKVEADLIEMLQLTEEQRNKLYSDMDDLGLK